MTDHEAQLAAARRSLAQPSGQVQQRLSATKLVKTLRAEIDAARAAGKTWAEVAADLAAVRSYSADTLRQAYAMVSRKPRSRTTKAAPVASARPAAAPNPASGARRPAAPPDLGGFAATRDMLAGLEKRP